MVSVREIYISSSTRQDTDNIIIYQHKTNQDTAATCRECYDIEGKREGSEACKEERTDSERERREKKR